MSTKRKPELSVIIVNYNGYSYASRCVKSVLSSKASSKEIILVDNHSTQSDVSLFKRNFGNKITIVSLKENYGPSKARNEGVKKSRGEYIAFLDNDTQVHPDWSNRAIKEFKSNKNIGIIQCKLLLLKEPTKIDYVGEYLGQNGFLVQRAKGGEIDTGKFNKKVELLAAKSAGMFIRREAFLSAGGFDSDYFIYVEETDLGWRSWLKGYKTVFLPSSIVYHEFGTSTVILSKAQNSYNAKFHGSKNYILTLIKNLSTLSLLKILPLHISLWVGMAVYIFFRGDYKSSIWILKGIGWNVVNLKKSLKKRVKIQKTRIISDKELFPTIMVKMPFTYFMHKVTKRHSVGNAKSF